MEVISLYPLAFCLLTLTGEWKLGELAQDCNTVCKTIGKDCDPLKASKLSKGKMAEIISAFNQTCDTIIECRFAATPSLNHKNECCTGKPWRLGNGKKPNCKQNHNTKRQLCYCGSKKGKFNQEGTKQASAKSAVAVIIPAIPSVISYFSTLCIGHDTVVPGFRALGPSTAKSALNPGSCGKSLDLT